MPVPLQMSTQNHDIQCRLPAHCKATFSYLFDLGRCLFANKVPLKAGNEYIA